MSWMTDNSAVSDAAGYLKTLFDTGECIPVPGVNDPLTGILAERMGFGAIYFSGAAFSASLGIPDIGLFSMTHLKKWLQF